MRTLLALFTLASLAVTTTRSQTATDFQSLAHLFDYDAKQPLDVQDKIIQEFPDGALDALSNPGGDGIIIFFGLAAPPAKAF